MTDRLDGKRVAILVEDDFDGRELSGARELLLAVGAQVLLVGPRAGGQFRARTGDTVVTADLAAGSVRAADIDALVVPGGYAPDRMRLRHSMVDLVRDTVGAGKPVAAICHGPQLLITARAVRGRTLTCWPSIAVDVKNAGGRYVDRPVVEDGNLITSRKPEDLPQFVAALVRALGGRAPSP